MLNEILKEVIETAYLHYRRAKNNYNEIQQFDINLNIYNDKEKVKTIDAFIYRFIKLQDFMSEKLFKELLKRIGEYKDNMSLLDVLDKLEKLEIIISADDWVDSRLIRNKLTHEYPNNTEDVLEGIRISLNSFQNIGDVLHRINNYVEDKELI